MIYYDNKSTEDEIKLYINTDGGDVDGFNHVYDIMQTIKAPVSTICLGKAYSAGAFLLASGSKGRRFALKHSSVMIHGIQCLFPTVPEVDMVSSGNYFDFLSKNNNNIIKTLAKHTNQPVSKVKEDCKRDLYLTAEQAKKYGIIDAIL